MDIQAFNDPIDELDIGSHKQNHLEGWRYGPKNLRTLKGYMTTYQDFTDMTPDEIMQKHFEKFLTSLFRVEKRAPISSFDKFKTLNLNSRLHFEQTAMQTLRISGELYIILSGNTLKNHTQALAVHKYCPALDKVYMIHEVDLGNVPIKVWPFKGTTWVQNGTSIFYFEIQNQAEEEKIVYNLKKYDLVTQVQTEIKTFTQELIFTLRHNGNRNPNYASGVLFANSNLENVSQNLNEHESQDQDTFINSLYVCITLEFFEDPKGETFSLELRKIGDFEKQMVAHQYPNSSEAVQTIFLHIDAKK